MDNLIRAAMIALLSVPVLAADLAPTGTLRATFLGNNPVQGTVDPKTGAVSGPVADIVRELARRSGVPYTIRPAGGAGEVIELLTNGAADIGFLALEAERARQVDFSVPYLLMGVTYLVPAASPLMSAADADRAGVKIGAVDNQAPTIYLKDNVKNASLVLWPAAPPYEELSKMFAAGQVDAFSGNRSRLVAAARSYPGLRVVRGDFARFEQNLVVRKGDARKLEIINQFLNEARESGFLQDSYSRSNLVGVELPDARR